MFDRARTLLADIRFVARSSEKQPRQSPKGNFCRAAELLDYRQGADEILSLLIGASERVAA